MATIPLTGLGWLAMANLQGARDAVESGTLAGQSFDTLLLWLCSAAITACCGWLWATTTVMVLAITRGHVRGRVRGCPEFLRRAILIACGVALAGSLSLPVHAADDVTSHPDVSSGIAPSLSGLPLPDRTDRPSPADAVAPIQAVDAGPTVEHLVTVQAGDTLWALAADSVGPDATTAAVAERTQQLHDLNRDVVGSDPDRIYPGQELRVPGGEEQ